jgi:hypothetical protein
MSKLTRNERLDRTALQYLRDHPRATNIQADITREADKPTLARLLRRGWIARPEGSEYTDQVAITDDGTDYLTELEQPWNTN